MKEKLLKTLICFLIVFILTPFSQVLSSPDPDDIREEINEKNEVIEQLEEEIKTYEKEIQVIGQEAKTLEGAVKKLDISEKKLKTDIAVTQNKIDTTNLTIAQLTEEINDLQRRVNQNSQAVAESIRNIAVADDTSMLETLLTYENANDFWSEVDLLDQFQESVQENTKNLIETRTELVSARNSKQNQKQKLVGYKENLSDQKEVVEYNKLEKETLLTKTKNKEENYKNLLEEKKAKRDLFIRELQDLEAALERAIDPSKLPEIGSAVLRWPFDTNHYNPFGIISQMFGGTQFAKNNPQVYGRPFHNGTDFAFPTGTPIKAAAGGVVKGFGNTDAIPGCYSYGKWILVEHYNGLSSLYAHLSVISVSKGQNVDTGDIIGYSGNTGYSTGPHLHFTVYATEGVEIRRLGDIKKITNCGNAYIPVAPYDAYFDPLSFLPQ